MTEAAASDAEEGYIWDVQEILAERPSISTDENEVLVVWKTAWIQKRCLIADCPAMRRWNEAAKWASCEDCCALLRPGITASRAAGGARLADGDRLGGSTRVAGQNVQVLEDGPPSW